MQPDDQALKEDGFRTSFRGFDKNDVLAYMNTLSNEIQQHEQEFEARIREMQSQMDALRKARQEADTRAVELQDQLAQAQKQLEEARQQTQRAETLRDKAEKQAAGYRSQCADRDKAIELLQARSEELQKKADELPAPRVEPQPAPRARDTLETARIEARRILEDARLYAKNAEQQLQREADAQKERMAENARGIAAGSLLLKDRLGRADQKISEASLELENATAALYQALEDTFTDLEALGAVMRDFSDGTPELDEPETVPASEASQETPEKPTLPEPPTGRPTVKARPVYRVKAPKPAPQHRLRRSYGRRAAAQNLEDALGRMGGET